MVDIMNQATDFAGKVKDSWNESFNNSSTVPESSPYTAAPEAPVAETVEVVNEDGTDVQ